MCAKLALGTYKWLVVCPLKCLLCLFWFVKASNNKNPLNKQIKKPTEKLPHKIFIVIIQEMCCSLIQGLVKIKVHIST